MELREFAERVLFARSLDDKLASPSEISDEHPGPALPAPPAPGRPPELRFKPQHSGKSNIPGIQHLDRGAERGRLLHFFANHELLATELMALVLLRFPEAPSAFRRAVLQTLKDEQQHTLWYLRRMGECGVAFGEMPLSGYFWRAVSNMGTPTDYLTGLSLTFEQANLDYAKFYAAGFAQAGDLETSLLLGRIYQDEIAHVACGLKWFRKWKDPRETDWDAFRRRLRFPLSAQRAKGPAFNVEGRVAAGLDPQFIQELKVFAQSKGRTPTVFVFNPFAEGRIAHGQSFTPNKHQALLRQDLENLPQFLSRQDDIVLVEKRPSTNFLNRLSEAGFAVPEFIELQEGRISPNTNLSHRKFGRVRPWAWGPDAVELLSPLLHNLTRGPSDANQYYNEAIGKLYSKEWSAGFLRKVIRQSSPDLEQNAAKAGNWLCTEREIGEGAGSLSEAQDRIRLIRSRGHHNVLVKQALGVAGHNAIRLLEPEILEAQQRWMARAVETGNRLVIEPWLDRVFDFSVQLEMEQRGLRLIGYTGLLNDWRGQYEGNWAGPGFNRRLGYDFAGMLSDIRDISRRTMELYAKILAQLETELRQYGYLGPVGIDAFIYRTPGGEFRLKPVVEINPRYTMGRLLLELMHYVAPGSTGTLRLINHQQIKGAGYDAFSPWAEALCKKSPILLEGEPVPKIRTGAVCLNEPASARVCVAIVEVTKTSYLPQTGGSTIRRK